MSNRTVEDRLREQYFTLLPEINRVAEELEARVRHCLLRIAAGLKQYERITVKCRTKECPSSIESLRRRQEGGTFDPDLPAKYDLTQLKDLAGARVLVFPEGMTERVDAALRDEFQGWTADPVLADVSENLEILALKYFGACHAVATVGAEYQIVSMSIGLFWDVEHAAIYKPAPELRGAMRELGMREHSADVIRALRSFESAFQEIVEKPAPSSVTPTRNTTG
jgi:hypothetical protein